MRSTVAELIPPPALVSLLQSQQPSISSAPHPRFFYLCTGLVPVNTCRTDICLCISVMHRRLQTNAAWLESLLALLACLTLRKPPGRSEQRCYYTKSQMELYQNAAADADYCMWKPTDQHSLKSSRRTRLLQACSFIKEVRSFWRVASLPSHQNP